MPIQSFHRPFETHQRPQDVKQGGGKKCAQMTTNDQVVQRVVDLEWLSLRNLVIRRL